MAYTQQELDFFQMITNNNLTDGMLNNYFQNVASPTTGYTQGVPAPTVEGGIDWAMFQSNEDYQRALLDLQQQQFEMAKALGMSEADLSRWMAEQNVANQTSQLELQRYLGLGGLENDAARTELEQTLGLGNLDLQRTLGLGSLEVQQQEQALRERLGLGELDLNRTLGLGGLDIQRQEQELAARMAANAQTNEERNYWLNREATLGQLSIDREKLGLEGQGLALQRELGLGQLGLSRDEMELQRTLGLGGLDVQRQDQALRERLGLGDLGLRGDELALQGELGRGQLGLSREELALQRQLGLGNLNLDREIQRGRLGLDSELGRGGLDIQRQQLGFQQGLATGTVNGQMTLEAREAQRELARNPMNAAVYEMERRGFLPGGQNPGANIPSPTPNPEQNLFNSAQRLDAPTAQAAPRVSAQPTPQQLAAQAPGGGIAGGLTPPAQPVSGFARGGGMKFSAKASAAIKAAKDKKKAGGSASSKKTAASQQAHADALRGLDPKTDASGPSGVVVNNTRYVQGKSASGKRGTTVGDLVNTYDRSAKMTRRTSDPLSYSTRRGYSGGSGMTPEERTEAMKRRDERRLRGYAEGGTVSTTAGDTLHNKIQARLSDFSPLPSSTPPPAVRSIGTYKTNVKPVDRTATTTPPVTTPVPPTYNQTQLDFFKTISENNITEEMLKNFFSPPAPAPSLLINPNTGQSYTALEQQYINTIAEQNGEAPKFPSPAPTASTTVDPTINPNTGVKYTTMEMQYINQVAQSKGEPLKFPSAGLPGTTTTTTPTKTTSTSSTSTQINPNTGKTYTAAEKSYINTIALQRGEPIKFPGYMHGGNVSLKERIRPKKVAA